MNKGRGIGLGIFLLTIGIISILLNLGLINWSIFDALFVLWPLILVVIGVEIIFHRNWIVRLLVWLAFLAVLIVYGNYLGDVNRSVNDSKPANEVVIEKPADLNKAILRLSLGACSIRLNSGTANLLEASIKDEDVKYTSDINSTDKSASIFFDRKNVTKVYIGSGVTNSFKLNEDVAWDIDVNTGASDCNLDMSELKVESFKYEGGASKVTAAFSDKSSFVNVKIDTGVSQVDLLVPETVGVRVSTDKGLSNTDFSGSGWIEKNGVFETDNYEQAVCKIDISADIGLSNFNIKRVK